MGGGRSGPGLAISSLGYGSTGAVAVSVQTGFWRAPTGSDSRLRSERRFAIYREMPEGYLIHHDLTLVRPAGCGQEIRQAEATVGERFVISTTFELKRALHRSSASQHVQRVGIGRRLSA